MDHERIGTEAQQALLRRFVTACQADEQIVAAFLGGSLATPCADPYSDLDLYLIIADDAYSDFFSGRQSFMRQLGEPVFLEDFNEFGFDMILFTFEDGTEGELALGRESNFDHIHGGGYKVLLDRKGVLTGKIFPLYTPAEADQQRVLYKQIYWFWENLSYFVKAMHRQQFWTAYGSLDEMRMKCLKLARLAHDFMSEQTAYSKAEQVVPDVELRMLAPSCCGLDSGAMIEAARVMLQFYRQVAKPLAAKHGLAYPEGLDEVVSTRLDELTSG